MQSHLDGSILLLHAAADKALGEILLQEGVHAHDGENGQKDLRAVSAVRRGVGYRVLQRHAGLAYRAVHDDDGAQVGLQGFQAHVLKQLSDGDSYGYRISKAVAEQSDGGLELKEATLYTAFRRLEAAGCIRSYWGDEQSGARRRYYSLTDVGLEKLLKDCETWRETRQVLDQLLGGESK